MLWVYHFHVHSRRDLCLHSRRGAPLCAQKEMRALATLPPKVPLESVHFSPFPTVTFLMKAASSSHLGLPPFLMVSLHPLYPSPPPLHSPHSSQCELVTWWLWSCPDDLHRELTRPFSSSPFALRVDTRIYHMVSSISAHVPFSSISLGSNHTRFSSTLRPPF